MKTLNLNISEVNKFIAIITIILIKIENMTESDHFKAQRANSLNTLITSADAWKVDIKYVRQAWDVLERAKIDLEGGILLKLQALRQKKLDEYVIKNCYQNKTYNFLHAQMCEQFHQKNDYKLNILESYFTDHLPKHLNEYQQCWKNPEFESLKTIEEKDLAFIECHDKWVKNIKENVVSDLETRAKALLE